MNTIYADRYAALLVNSCCEHSSGLSEERRYNLPPLVITPALRLVMRDHEILLEMMRLHNRYKSRDKDIDNPREPFFEKSRLNTVKFYEDLKHQLDILYNKYPLFKDAILAHDKAEKLRAIEADLKHADDVTESAEKEIERITSKKRELEKSLEEVAEAKRRKQEEYTKCRREAGLDETVATEERETPK
jgi:hypothetical protein